MKKIFNTKFICLIISSFILTLIPNIVFASAFQLWEQDGASIGNYHAGRAAASNDASTAYYNPAGLINITNQQLVVGAVPVVADVRFRGAVKVRDYLGSSFSSTNFIAATTQGGGFTTIPSLHYAAPLNNRIVFGLSIAAPFGLEINYGRNTAVKYTAMKTGLTVVDLAPSVGIAITDKLSTGFGFDAEHASAEFDLMAGVVDGLGIIDPDSNTISKNSAKSWAYGYHLGLLYQFSKKTRIGLAYKSQVRHSLKGNSKFIGILAGPDSFMESRNLKSNITFPPTTTLSFFSAVNSMWDLMATASYTQWSIIDTIKLQNTIGINNEDIASDLLVTIPQHFRNTWNLSFGGNYHLNKKWIFKSGIGYDQTPTRDAYRNLYMPDNNRIVFALGSHTKISDNLYVDFGWAHIFVVNTRINNIAQKVGDQETIVNGSVQSNADVFGMQLKWNIV